MLNRSKGQALAEYGLVGALITVAIIAPFTSFGQNAATTFKKLETKTKQQTTAKANNNALLNPIAGPALPNLSNVAITLSNGSQLQVNNYPTKVENMVQTTGANGTSELLLSDLDSLIQQLVANGEATPEQANLLQQLSNQGHQLAGIEAIIQNAADNSNGQPSLFLDQQLTYNGKTYKTDDLATLVGVDDPNKLDKSQPSITVNGMTFNAGPAALQFFELLNQVNQLNLDPAVLQTVNTLSKQIGEVGNIVQSGVHDVAMFSSPVENYISAGIGWANQESIMPSTADSLADLPAAVVTANNSTAICTTGGSTDTGQQCQ